jgi:hypothetical protein
MIMRRPEGISRIVWAAVIVMSWGMQVLHFFHSRFTKEGRATAQFTKDLIAGKYDDEIRRQFYANAQPLPENLDEGTRFLLEDEPTKGSHILKIEAEERKRNG